MGLLGAAGFLALAGAIASCAALDGLGDYRECAGPCGETGPGDETSRTLPDDSGASPPGDDDTSPGEASPPEGDDTVGPTDANGVDGPPPDDGASEGSVRLPPYDGAADAPGETAPETSAPPMTGATCGPRGTTTRCSAQQVCCGSLATQTNACATSCASNATFACIAASDCPSSAPICCAQAILTPDSANDLPPRCAATSFSASCASACADVAPTSCAFIGTVRLCAHDADCQSDAVNPLAGGQCWNFNGAPESWCTSLAVGTAGGGVHVP